MDDGPYRLTKPCPGCPFRTDEGAVRLNRARVTEIERSLVRAEFPCHETTGVKGPVPATGKAHCAGALILLEKLGRPSQMMRISERLGMYDARKLHMDAPVFDTFGEMRAAQPKARR